MRHRCYQLASHGEARRALDFIFHVNESAVTPPRQALALWPIEIAFANPHCAEHHPEPPESRRCMRGTSPPVDQRTKIPLTIVVGAPGAGTSSLVRHLLEQTTERRIAAVVPADEVIDASLIAERNGGRM